jgi:hypothetical protein
MKVYLLVNLTHRPLKETLEQVMLMGNEIFFIIILIIFMIMDINSNNISLDQLRGSYGNTIIIFYILVLAFNCGIGFLSTYYTIKEMCAKKKIEKTSKAGGLTKIIEKREKALAEKAKRKGSRSG